MASLDSAPTVPTAAAFDRVEASLASRGARLTRLRRVMLGLLLDAGRPLGAYLLMERLRAMSRHVVAPPTIYRALDFLVS